MTAVEVIKQFKSLPPKERQQVAQFVVTKDDSWIPEAFKQSMKAFEEGRSVDMEIALKEPPPSKS